MLEDERDAAHHDIRERAEGGQRAGFRTSCGTRPFQGGKPTDSPLPAVKPPPGAPARELSYETAGRVGQVRWGGQNGKEVG